MVRTVLLALVFAGSVSEAGGAESLQQEFPMATSRVKTGFGEAVV
jgi:hypothetical protein